MLYLEDYLEMIEHLPQELRDRFTEMREMDLQVHNAMDNLEDQVKQFFSNAKRMKIEQRDNEYDKIKQEYYKTLEDAEEKVHLANQIYELVDKYLRRLDQELQKFKIELEADNAGITEILERRSLELDNPPPTVVNHVREKRKYTFHNNNSSINAGPTNNSSYAMPHHDRHDRHLVSSAEKVLSTIAQEVYRETIAVSNVGPSGGMITSNNITSNRLNSNAFTPLLAVVSANNNNVASNGNAIIGTNNSLSSLIPSPTSSLPIEKNNATAGASMIPHGTLRCNLGNTAIAAAASQAIAATQQMQQGRRTASLKASYEAINAGFPNICGFSSMRDSNKSFESPISHQDVISHFTSAGFNFDSMQSANKSGRATKRSRGTSSQFSDGPSSSNSLALQNSYEDESSEALLNEENNGITEWYDPNEPRYCICNQVSYGDMVACDNEDCQKEWFHYGCVGITQPPKGKWFCPDCSEKMNRRKNRKERS